EKLHHKDTEIAQRTTEFFHRQTPAKSERVNLCYPNENPKQFPCFPDDAVAILSIDPSFPSRVG
ncbi:MAG TPA: hypothetical protein VGW32_01610, partial [Pyrinomonadaceae bacterium]|nr:hypothetical protein [Pyrinomonadaceae bacterium]